MFLHATRSIYPTFNDCRTSPHSCFAIAIVICLYCVTHITRFHLLSAAMTTPAENAQSNELLRFGACASGICFCYWFYGIMQENLLTQSKLGATFVLVTQTVANVFVALLWQRLEGRGSQKSSSLSMSGRVLRHPLLLLTSAVYVFAMACSNEALQFVSYPTAVLAKSCKLIPTMIMGWLLEKRLYSVQQWASALFISAGISLFHISRIHHHPGTEDVSFHDGAWKGMSLLCISLLMDGCLGACQGVLKRKDPTGKKRPPTAVETMLYINIYALLFLIPMAVSSGQMKVGLQTLPQDRTLFLTILVLNGVVSIGQIFIFLTITWYSSLVCTTITTTRKFFTILFSVLYFGHRFSMNQWIAVSLVFGGLYLSIVAKDPPQPNFEKSSHAKVQ
jgi:UDP-galactose transporter B1